MVLQLLLLLEQIGSQLVVDVGEQVGYARLLVLTALAQRLNHLLANAFAVGFILFVGACLDALLIHVRCQPQDGVILTSPNFLLRRRTVQIRIVGGGVIAQAVRHEFDEERLLVLDDVIASKLH